MERKRSEPGRSESSDTPLHILVVDDHVIVREGLKRLLERSGAGWRVTEADSGLAALSALRQHPFDVAIVDVSMPGMNGLDFVRRARSEAPRLHILVLSMHDEDQFAMRALRAGARGYLTKDCAGQELLAAVRKVAAGGTYVSAQLAERAVLQLSGSPSQQLHSQLSDRELDVLQRLVAGQRPTDIAQALHLSVKTVSTHKSRIQERLQLPNLAALIRYGMEHGLGGDRAAAADGD
ncbi:MAG: response regulator [Inhella sp.]|jgi:two-component system invasion response regulator UvrY|uniref:response regulator n=1 Tax=Inhella sp. TaxID=1921806 RepID=UPI0022CB9CD8|nr:response regulator transcription factor [Inhella sp.]MCZ8234301.1 response regulator transcription factor [Inhella sp.]